MNIVWFSWKDLSHPEAGGAETVSGELMKNLAKDGHSVKLITARHKGSKASDIKDGIEVIRVGGRFTVYLAACAYYLRHLKHWPDIIIDEMNTIPFFTGLYVKSAKRILLTYQLAREVWLYQMPFPFSRVGYLLEPLMLRIINHTYDAVLTESNSTRQDLIKYGFSNVHTFRVGMDLAPVHALANKQPSGKVLSLGAIRPMKRTLDIVKAFEVARDANNELTLALAGDTNSNYAKKVLEYIQKSRHSLAIDVRGRVSMQEKQDLMISSDTIVVTSIKEGWGLIITEAGSQGTPAIAYDADGLRDSVVDNETGLLAPSGNYEALGEKINILLADPIRYSAIRTAAWKYSKQFTFENSYSDFLSILKSES